MESRVPSRRQMLGLAASAATALRMANADPAPELSLSIFSKHLHFVKDEALAEAALQIGVDGVDLTVRGEGHVLPDRVAADLPRLVAILRKQNLKVPMVTTNIVDARSSHAEAVVATCAKLGIRNYRWVGFKYEADRPILQQLDALKPRVASLAALNRKYGVRAMYHTHSGVGLVGASIWDLNYLLKDFDPEHVSVNYDVGHATIEGGYGGWINSFHVTGPHLGGIALKDFAWGQDKAGAWRARWRPVGEGMVRFGEFFAMVRNRKFSGPVQIHFEYPLGGAESGKTELSLPASQVLNSMTADVKRVREFYRASSDLGGR